MRAPRARSLAAFNQYGEIIIFVSSITLSLGIVSASPHSLIMSIALWMVQSLLFYCQCALFAHSLSYTLCACLSLFGKIDRVDIIVNQRLLSATALSLFIVFIFSFHPGWRGFRPFFGSIVFAVRCCYFFSRISRSSVRSFNSLCRLSRMMSIQRALIETMEKIILLCWIHFCRMGHFHHYISICLMDTYIVYIVKVYNRV